MTCMTSSVLLPSITSTHEKRIRTYMCHRWKEQHPKIRMQTEIGVAEVMFAMTLAALACATSGLRRIQRVDNAAPTTTYSSKLSAKAQTWCIILKRLL